jgi:YesN/AraC family two-component response regulator
MKIHIKYMVSNRCKMVVRMALKELDVHFVMLELGEVEIMERLTGDQRDWLKLTLEDAGLELIDDKRSILIERIKSTIIDMVHYPEQIVKVNVSNYLSEKLNHDYTYLANIFSQVQGISIEQFIILHKVEKIKEFLMYGELNIAEISYKMNYSSSAHLSSQFKKVTGFTPTQFKQLKDKRRQLIDQI